MNEELSEDKKSAFDILRTGNNVFLTGSAGSGKTYLLNYYIKYLKERGVNVAVTASTGIAATHISGQTIHSWSGIGIKQGLTDFDLEMMESKKYLWERFDRVKVLIIDEISMLHRKTLDDVDRVLKFFKRNDKPFGGVYVIFSGDFFQLPPVTRNGEMNREKFAFMSEAWLNANLKICYLQKQFRQTDQKLLHLLEEMRTGNISKKSIDFLDSCKDRKFDDEVNAIKLFTHNMDVDSMNEVELEKIDGDERIYIGESKGRKNLIESLKKSVLAPEKLRLRIGAKIIFVKNNYEMGYLNGTMGEIIKFSMNGYPVVKITGGKEITSKREEWNMENEKGKILASFSQIPLRLAWAITVHKSQGMTLDRAEMDLSKTFEKGQGYVALSRVKNFSGLKLLGYNQRALESDYLVLVADKRFRELSEDAVSDIEEIDKKEIKRASDNFIITSNGTILNKKIELNKRKIKLKKVEQNKIKIPTILITKKLIDQGKEIEEIANERCFTEQTIFSHIEKLKKQFPKMDIEKFRPGKKIFKKVQKAVKKLKKENEKKSFTEGGELRLSSIFKELNKKVSYNEIKGVILFLE